jgi:hypothetical protein
MWAGILTLDDSSAPSPLFATWLKARFPEIDSVEAIENLSELLEHQFQNTSFSETGHAYMSIPMSATLDALASSSISNAAKIKIANDL